MTYTAKFGANVKRQRERLGLTQAQLADMLDMHHSHFNGLETGRRNPSLKTICRLAKVLDCRPCDLVEGVALDEGEET